jgi:hypothetical protein
MLRKCIVTDAIGLANGMKQSSSNALTAAVILTFAQGAG